MAEPDQTAGNAHALTLRYVDEPVGVFHHRGLDGVDHSQMWIPRLSDRPVLVLGSRQTPDSVDSAVCEQRGIEVVGRRSGGGAVLVGTEQLMWFDVVLTRDHPGWNDDVGKSFAWVSDRIRSALASLGVQTECHNGPMVNTEWSDLVCFAGLGPGELTIDGKKLVGISQRRTRQAARFQVAILRRWDPMEMLELFPMSDADRERANQEMASMAVGTTVSPSALYKAAAHAVGVRDTRFDQTLPN